MPVSAHATRAHTLPCAHVGQPADSLLTYRLIRPLYSDGPRPRRAGPAPCLCLPRPGLALNLSRLAPTDGTPVRVLEVLRAAMGTLPGCGGLAFGLPWCCAVYCPRRFSPPGPRRLPHLCPPGTHLRPFHFRTPSLNSSPVSSLPRPQSCSRRGLPPAS